MEDGETNEGDTAGKETPEVPEKPAESNSGSGESTALDRAEKNIKDRETICAREEKILDRKEKLKAIEMVGGQTVAGGEEQPKKEETPHEYHERIKKEMAEGKTEFGN